MKKALLILLLLIAATLIVTRINMNVSDSEFLDDYLGEIESFIDRGDSLNQEVSQVSVAWHLHHSLLTIDQIYMTLETSDPEKFESEISAIRTLSLTGNFIPRGLAQSPDSVRPPEEFTNQDIKELLDKIKRLESKFTDLDEHSFFDHPYFGHLNRSHSMRFLQVHTNHHLKIIKDIVKK
ncbi:MAG: DUF1569 domain-containing protein [Bacteroidia bacterium]|nr:DUF1569 domain-containing protein [Bacteroidia bacterium]NNK73799.1 DUF1569 domain-containing protein [Flavobacteriaceae bacterium]